MDNPLLTLHNRRILLGITGGIAAYKSAELTRRLQDLGADVRVIMTRSATEFITPLTMQALSKHPVHLTYTIRTLSRSWATSNSHVGPISCLLPPPVQTPWHGLQVATATTFNRVCLAAECPVAVAPAMNQAMWAKHSTQKNRAILSERGIHFLGPDSGLQACGEVGAGRYSTSMRYYWRQARYSLLAGCKGKPS